MLTRFIRHYLLALQFFTRIPVTGRLAAWVGFSPAMLRASAAHFPGVGWVIGSLTALCFFAVMSALPPLPASAWVAAALSTVFSILLTGAFHEDGLADTADGLGGGLTRERALDIMKDSRVGAYGAIALVMALFSKLALLVLLHELDARWVIAGLFAAHVTSRLMPLFIIRTMAHVGDTPQSKSKPLAESISSAGVIAGLMWWLAAMVLASQFLPLAPLAAAVIGSASGMAVMAWRLKVRLQGFTGDGLGATQQLAEIGFYLGLVFSAGLR